MGAKEEVYSQVWNTDNDRLGSRDRKKNNSKKKKKKVLTVILFINWSTDVGRNKTKQR